MSCLILRGSEAGYDVAAHQVAFDVRVQADGVEADAEAVRETGDAAPVRQKQKPLAHDSHD